MLLFCCLGLSFARMTSKRAATLMSHAVCTAATSPETRRQITRENNNECL